MEGKSIAIAYFAVPKVLRIVIGASATLPKVVTSIKLPSLDDYAAFIYDASDDY